MSSRIGAVWTSPSSFGSFSSTSSFITSRGSFTAQPRDAPESVVHGRAFYAREHSFPDFAVLDAFMDDFRRRFDYIE